MYIRKAISRKSWIELVDYSLHFTLVLTAEKVLTKQHELIYVHQENCSTIRLNKFTVSNFYHTTHIIYIRLQKWPLCVAIESTTSMIYFHEKQHYLSEFTSNTMSMITTTKFFTLVYKLSCPVDLWKYFLKVFIKIANLLIFNNLVVSWKILFSLLQYGKFIFRP